MARRDPICRRHTPIVGRIAWPTGIPPRDQAHASTVVCDRTACQDDATAWVREITGHDGEFVPFTPEES